MQHNYLARLCGTAFAIALLAAPSASTAQAPALDIPPIELTTGLSPNSIQKIENSLKHYVNLLVQAQKQSEILNAREALLGIYNTYDSPTFKYAVAGKAAEQLLPLLEQDDLQKQINAALVLARMPQFSVQDALEKMVVHANPAVRYLGWVGYRAARGRILAQHSAAATDKMFASLKKAAVEEPSSIVTRSTFNAMYFATVPPDSVSRTDFDNARRKSLEALRGCWAKRCMQVRNGDVQIAEALRVAVSAISNAWDVLGADRQQQTIFLQMIVDAAWCSATAYDEATRTVENAVSLAKDDAGRKVAINTLLLRDCEQALNNIKGRNSSFSIEGFIEKALTDTKIPDRAAAPLGGKDPATGEYYGVLGWVNELKDDGITQPQMTAPTTPVAPGRPEG